MKPTIRCQCGFDVPFAEEDRGSDVYCPSCGKVCLVPEVDPADAPSAGQPTPEPSAPTRTTPAAPAPASEPSEPTEERPESSIFSASGSLRVADRTIGEVTCLCGTKVPYRVEDFGSSVYCPACGVAVPVGRTLGRPRVPAATGSEPFEQRPSAEEAARTALGSRGRRSPLALVAMVGIVATLGAGGLLALQRQGIISAKLLPWQPIPSAAPVAAAAPSPVPGGEEATVEEDGHQAPEEITLQRIEELGRREDFRMALIDAQILGQVLIDRGIAEDDPRRVRLGRIIAELIDRLRPRSGSPPAYVAQFREQVAKLRVALSEHDLPPAREADARAQALFEAHPDELAPYSRSFLALKKRLEEFTLAAAGSKPIEDLLMRARRLAADDKPTDAIECAARAKSLAFRTPLEPWEARRLEERLAELNEPLRFARGRRAVREARQCARAGDRQARDQLVREARAILPGLSESKIRPLMARVEKIATAKIASPRSSALGTEIACRRLYESALEHYGQNEWDELLAACHQAQQLLASLPASSRRERGAKLAKLVLDTLERGIADLFAKPDSADLPRELARLRGAFDQAARWQFSSSLPRWQSLDAALRACGNQLTDRIVDESRALAAEGKLAEAVAKIMPVESLGGADAAERARFLREQWQHQLQARASLAAREEVWHEIVRLVEQDQPLRAWRDLASFERRFPDSPETDEIRKLRARLRPAVDRQLSELMRRVNDTHENQDWIAFRAAVSLLETAPLQPEHREGLQAARKELELLDQRAEGRFLQAKPYRHLVSRQDVLGLLELLPEVLALNPDHRAAQFLFEKARRAGTRYAEGLLKSAGTLKGRRQAYRKRLETILALDPLGPHSAKTRELLENH